MAIPTRSATYRLKYPDLESAMGFSGRAFQLKKVTWLMLIFWAGIFLLAFFYVEQQIRLQSMNYKIIEFKQQRKQLLEQQKTYQLQLDQAKRLDQVEVNLRKQGFEPVTEGQVRLVR